MMFPDVCGAPDEADDVEEGACLQEVSAAHVQRQFFDVRVLASGWYTQVFSARHQRLSEGRRLVLKAVRRGTTTRRDFLREARHHAFLSACPHVLACFPPAFATASSFVLPLEEAPAGDLAGLVGRGGVSEEVARRVAAQVGAAVSFMHAAGVVHRDVTPANLLAMDEALAQVKLADFGATRRVGAMVTRGALPLPWLAPEVACLHAHDLYAAHPAQDAWQLGLLLVVLLTGALPWAAADPEDPHYAAWEAWACHASTGLPPRFRLFSPRLLCLLRRLLHPQPELRCPAAALQQEAGRRWLARNPDPFDPCLLQDAPRPAAFLRRAEQRVARVLRRYLRRASPRYKKVTFAAVLEERREVERHEEEDDQEEGEEEEEEEYQEGGEEEQDMGGWFLGSECILDYYCAPP